MDKPSSSILVLRNKWWIGVVTNSRFLLLFSVVFLSPCLGFATSIEWASTKEVALDSDRIVLAKCVSVETRKVERYGNNIFTFSNFESLNTITGNIGESFTLRLFGGRIGDLVADAPMMPRFTPGEQVILMLGPDNKDGYPVIDVLGVLRTDIDPLTDRRLVTTEVSDLPIYDVNTQTLLSNGGLRIFLDDLIYSLRKLLGI